MKELIMRFFAWLGGVLADPADEQGSTKRLVMFIFLTNFMALFTGVVIGNGWKFTEIPQSVLYLVFGILGAMGFLVTVDKGIAAYKEVNSPCEPKGAANVADDSSVGVAKQTPGT